MTKSLRSSSHANSTSTSHWNLIIHWSLRHWALVIATLFTLLGALTVSAAEPAPTESSRWWKGNLHTHSFWSDGDDFPESILDWYKTNGYHFVALSDHNVTQTHERWMTVTNAAKRVALDKFIARFGERAVVRRPFSQVLSVRLSRLHEFAPMFNEAGRFLVIPAEEITARHKTLPIHINATNLRREIEPRTGTNVLDVIQRNLDAIIEQRRQTGQPILPHINHPNFGWAMTAEELMQVRGERFFEIYNGHPTVNNEGDTNHAGLDRVWDIVLAHRLTSLKLGPFYGLAVDDSHHYHQHGIGKANTGRGWVMVRAAKLDAGSLIAAMEAGDCYASSGVRLKDVRRTTNELALEIDGDPGVTYKTEFIGTLRGFDPASQPGPRPTNSIYAVTRLYTEQIGAVLAVNEGGSARYKLAGDEIYVRARVTSSRPKLNGSSTNEFERAWTQPLVGPRAEAR